MPESIEIGTVSSRGQIAIPSEMRQLMGLKEGEKVLFLLDKGTLLVKKVQDMSWETITKPLREAKKKLPESKVPGLVERLRRRK
jgi:AbrB family looped-hinge helix DNA binding protein